MKRLDTSQVFCTLGCEVNSTWTCWSVSTHWSINRSKVDIVTVMLYLTCHWSTSSTFRSSTFPAILPKCTFLNSFLSVYCLHNMNVYVVTCSLLKLVSSLDLLVTMVTINFMDGFCCNSKILIFLIYSYNVLDVVKGGVFLFGKGSYVIFIYFWQACFTKIYLLHMLLYIVHVVWRPGKLYICFGWSFWTLRDHWTNVCIMRLCGTTLELVLNNSVREFVWVLIDMGPKHVYSKTFVT